MTGRWFTLDRDDFANAKQMSGFHASHVNLDQIVSISENEDGRRWLYLANGTSLQITESAAERLKRAINL